MTSQKFILSLNFFLLLSSVQQENIITVFKTLMNGMKLFIRALIALNEVIGEQKKLFKAFLPLSC